MKPFSGEGLLDSLVHKSNVSQDREGYQDLKSSLHMQFPPAWGNMGRSQVVTYALGLLRANIRQMSGCVVDSRVLSAVVQLGISGCSGSQVCPGLRTTSKQVFKLILKPGLVIGTSRSWHEG